jgi:hypothetical protein
MTKTYRTRLSELRKVIKELKIEVPKYPKSTNYKGRFIWAMSEAARDDELKSGIEDDFKTTYKPIELKYIIKTFNKYIDNPRDTLYHILHEHLSLYDVEQIAKELISFNVKKFDMLVDKFFEDADSETVDEADRWVAENGF